MTTTGSFETYTDSSVWTKSLGKSNKSLYTATGVTMDDGCGDSLIEEPDAQGQSILKNIQDLKRQGLDDNDPRIQALQQSMKNIGFGNLKEQDLQRQLDELRRQ